MSFLSSFGGGFGGGFSDFAGGIGGVGTSIAGAFGAGHLSHVMVPFKELSDTINAVKSISTHQINVPSGPPQVPSHLLGVPIEHNPPHPNDLSSVSNGGVMLSSNNKQFTQQQLLIGGAVLVAIVIFLKKK